MTRTDEKAPKSLIEKAYRRRDLTEAHYFHTLLPKTVMKSNLWPPESNRQEITGTDWKTLKVASGKVLQTAANQSSSARERRHDETQEKFKRLKAQWIKEQATSSRLKNVVYSIPYQNIIGMGKDALPFILSEIRTSPYYWFWALERITEANPAANATTHEEMVSAWLEWAEKNA